MSARRVFNPDIIVFFTLIKVIMFFTLEKIIVFFTSIKVIVFFTSITDQNGERLLGRLELHLEVLAEMVLS